MGNMSQKKILFFISFYCFRTCSNARNVVLITAQVFVKGTDKEVKFRFISTFTLTKVIKKIIFVMKNFHTGSWSKQYTYDYVIYTR